MIDKIKLKKHFLSNQIICWHCNNKIKFSEPSVMISENLIQLAKIINLRFHLDCFNAVSGDLYKCTKDSFI